MHHPGIENRIIRLLWDLRDKWDAFLIIKYQLFMTVDNNLGYLGQTWSSVKSSGGVVPIIKPSWDKSGQRKLSIYKVSQVSQLSLRNLVEHRLKNRFLISIDINHVFILRETK